MSRKCIGKAPPDAELSLTCCDFSPEVIASCSSGVIVQPLTPSDRPASAAGSSGNRASGVPLDGVGTDPGDTTPGHSARSLNKLLGELTEWQLL